MLGGRSRNRKFGGRAQDVGAGRGAAVVLKGLCETGERKAKAVTQGQQATRSWPVLLVGSGAGRVCSVFRVSACEEPACFITDPEAGSTGVRWRRQRAGRELNLSPRGGDRRASRRGPCRQTYHLAGSEREPLDRSPDRHERGKSHVLKTTSFLLRAGGAVREARWGCGEAWCPASGSIVALG